MYQNGVYVPGEAFLKKECRKRLQNAADIKRVDEVIAHITDMTYTEPDSINTYKHLINLSNGMLDWAANVLLPHHAKYRSTIQSPVVYDPEAGCPIIDEFLASTLSPDCIPLIEEIFGYCLIIDTRFEKAFILTGTGANGKSTTLSLLDTVVGSRNVSKIPLQSLDQHRFKRAELFGKSINMFADLSDTAVKNSSYFKAIVSGDPIDAERKFRDPFWFHPTARLVFSANQVPYSPDRGYAFYRRLILVPFLNQFVGNKADRDLIGKMTQPDELSGLLNRALKGLKRLFDQEHFSEGEASRNALDAYKRSSDTVEAFAQDHCDFDDLGAKVERTKLYAMYMSYCKGERRRPVSRQKFYDRIKAGHPGVGRVMGDRGKRYLTGIRLTGRRSANGNQ